ncbi:unnamed protein product [Rhizophagus irregularis]|nr:unnamed protein product [Rhizophagus irregularis]
MKLEKEVRIITEKFKDLEKKKEQGMSSFHKKVKDNSGQTKKNSSSRRRKSQKNSDTQNYPNGKITELSDCYNNCDEMDGKYNSNKSCDMTFYDFPWYFVLDEEIFECIRDVVYVEKITV